MHRYIKSYQTQHNLARLHQFILARALAFRAISRLLVRAIAFCAALEALLPAPLAMETWAVLTVASPVFTITWTPAPTAIALATAVQPKHVSWPPSMAASSVSVSGVRVPRCPAG